MTPDLIIGLIALTLLLVLEGSMPFYLGREQRWRHGLRNGTLAALNGAIGVLLAPLLLAVIAFAEQQGIGLLHWLSLDQRLGAGPITTLIELALAILLFDLWMYAWHRANHEIPFLWRFHQVHHTDPAMDATTALRFHPGELIISSLLNPLIILALGMGLTQLILYKALMLPVILFHHSNLRVPSRWDARLRGLIVPPSMHRVHHSNIRAETDSNYGTLFSFWDRLFGSFRLRPDLDQIVFGTGHHDEPAWQTITRLLRLPLAPMRTPAQSR
ncbi:sterol desaturase family protein [Halochromatium roseum]|uniref:sterol desaturase family protein n=1 Tax=Halochromatium roseum TaxID=391920 RepID=UPI001913592F|nr:sterol desaturase family protein [Halochromatium roseum]MBK5938936.1 sterol desaturase [Halochromatium roseum]